MNSLRWLIPALLLMLATSGAGPQTEQSDPVFAALDAELTRSINAFGKQVPATYFLGYEAWDNWRTDLVASRGVLLSSDTDLSDRERLVDVDVRVGDYHRDNTHPLQGVAGMMGGFSWGRPEPLPLEDDLAALRAAIWRRTEQKYTQAAVRFGQLGANQATTATPADTSPDFSREEPLRHIEPPLARPAVDRAAWGDRVRRWSARFSAYPMIYDSHVQFSATHEVRYIVNSEGTRVRTGTRRARIIITAGTRASDGMDLSVHRSFDAGSPDSLPDEARVALAIDSVIADIEGLRVAPSAEPFSGPAIMSGAAAGVFFHEIFGHRIEGHRQKDESFAQTFTHRVGEAVLPSYITVIDDPTRRQHAGTDLNGHYEVDDEGVAARPTMLVRKGLLEGFLMGRSPIRGHARSNGHGRRQPGLNAVARQGNLIIESARTVEAGELRAQLVAEIKRQNKPYGLRFEDIQGGFTFTGRLMPQSFKVLPVKVYRVYADGRPDQLIRGVDMVGTPLTVFSKILATDDQPRAFNGYCGAESGFIPVSAVSPAVLFAEIEVEKKTNFQLTQPVLPPPATAVRSAVTEDVVFEAFADELQRTLQELRIPGVPPPYYAQLRADDQLTLRLEGSLGSLVMHELERNRVLSASMRIGSPQTDNSGYLDPMRSGLRWQPIPLDDDYGAIRRAAWQLFDSQYKAAAEGIARKQTIAGTLGVPDTVPDFTEEAAHVSVQPPTRLAIVEAPWINLTRKASAVFRNYPAIEESRVRINVNAGQRHLASTEQTRVRMSDASYRISVTATARTANGRPLHGERQLVAPGNDAVAEAEVTRIARELAEDLSARAIASDVADYMGPVLFTGAAAPQLFFALFGQHAGIEPPPVLPQQMVGRMPQPESPLRGRIGQQVLPTQFSVVDDPSLVTVASVAAAGHYQVDDEGVPARAITLVDKGILKRVLTARTPIKQGEPSTGHARSGFWVNNPRPVPGTLIVRAEGDRSIADLRKQLIDAVRERNLPFGIIVYQLADPLLAPPPTEPQAMFMNAQRRLPEIPAAVRAARVYPDGREERISDAAFAGATLRTLRDIEAAATDVTVHNFLQPPVSASPFGFSFFGDMQDGIPTTVAAPSVLVDELEVNRVEPSGKPPVLKHPLFAAP